MCLDPKWIWSDWPKRGQKEDSTSLGEDGKLLKVCCCVSLRRIQPPWEKLETSQNVLLNKQLRRTKPPWREMETSYNDEMSMKDLIGLQNRGA